VSQQRLGESADQVEPEYRQPKKSLSVVIESRDFFDLSREINPNSNAHHSLGSLDISWESGGSCVADADIIDEKKNAFIFEERKESNSIRKKAQLKLEQEALEFLRQNEVHPSQPPQDHVNKRKIDDFDVSRLISSKVKSAPHKSHQVATKAYKQPKTQTKDKQFGKAKISE